MWRRPWLVVSFFTFFFWFIDSVHSKDGTAFCAGGGFSWLIGNLRSPEPPNGMQPKLASKNALASRDPFLGSPEKLFYVCSVCLQYQSFNNFENDRMKVSVKEAKLTGLWARNCATIQRVLISKFTFGPETLPGPSRNRLQGRQR